MPARPPFAMAPCRRGSEKTRGWPWSAGRRRAVLRRVAARAIESALHRELDFVELNERRDVGVFRNVRAEFRGRGRPHGQKRLNGVEIELAAAEERRRLAESRPLQSRVHLGLAQVLA